MALHTIQAGGKVALGYDDSTGERGFLMKMVNKTGAATVKGTLVSASTGTDFGFTLQANEFDTFGIVQEAGVADASEAWVWINGSYCQVLFKDGESSTRGYVVLAADTDGTACNVEVPTSTPTNDSHWKEIGHVLQTLSSGTNVLVLCHIHFN